MKFARFFALAALLLVAATAQAGTIHPALQAKMDQTPLEEPISVIVNMTTQAPIAELNYSLKVSHVGRRERHRQVVEALQQARSAQQPLQGALEEAIRSGGVLGYTSYWISNLVVVYAFQPEIERIAARPDVDVVELNFTSELIRPVEQPDQSIEIGEEAPGDRGIGVTPGLRAIHAPEVWYQLGYNGTGTLIGGLDTGVDGNHPALNTRWRGYNGAEPWQECWLDVLGTGTQFPVDGYGHGTHTMGTMTGLGAATQDTVGVAWGAKWIACNAIDQGVGSGFDNDILTAFQWFADPDGNPNTVDDVPDVVQNSWGVYEGLGYPDCFNLWWTVIDNCEAASVCVTWSAGNEGSSPQTLRSPADRATTLTNCFSVGAVDATSYSWPYPIATWSSRGPSGCSAPPENLIKPEVCAPGVNVYSSVPGGGYSQNYSGTSMAGPHVAGTVALLRQANPDLDVDTIKQILMDTARDEGATGEDNTYGWGFIDAFAAVQAATVGFGAVEGHIYNASWNNVPIDGARVKLIETGAQFLSDGSGFYHGSAAAGDYNAECSKDGFATVTLPINVASNETTTQNFYLTDIAGPAITDVTPGFGTPDSVGPYPIQATVRDYSSVAWVKLIYRLNQGGWIELPMTGSLNVYNASLAGMPPGSRIDYYIQAQDGIGLTSVEPANAPSEFHSIYITTPDWYAYQAEDPGDPNWQLGMAGDNATSGIWIRDDPVGTVYNGQQVQPEDDHTPDPGVKCFVTGNGTPGGAAGDNDVDGGCTSLRSPIFDLSEVEAAVINYWRWYAMAGNSMDDQFAVDVSSNGGGTWIPLERVPDNENYWSRVSKDLSQYITLTDQVVFRFQACDLGNGGLVEAAIDDVSIDVFIPNTSGVGESGWIHRRMELSQNAPNPFRPVTETVTTINFRLSNPAPTRLTIHDASGRLIRTLLDKPLSSGAHSIDWDGRDDQGQQVGSGVYFYHINAGAFEQGRRLTVVR